MLFYKVIYLEIKEEWILDILTQINKFYGYYKWQNLNRYVYHKTEIYRIQKYKVVNLCVI